VTASGAEGSFRTNLTGGAVFYRLEY